MNTLNVKDAAGQSVYLRMIGAGTISDPSMRVDLAHVVSGIVALSDGTLVVVKGTLVTVAANATAAVVIAAVVGKKIRVLSVVAPTPTSLIFDTVSPTFTGILLPDNPHGWFETAVGASLTASTGAGNDVILLISYIEVFGGL